MVPVAENPFYAGGAVTAKHFIGRSAEINEIFGNINNKTHLAIYGSPGFGKGSLLRAIQQPETWQARGLDPHSATVIWVNCGNFSPFTPEAFWRKLLERLDEGADAGLKPVIAAGLNKAATGRDDLQKVLDYFLKQHRVLVMLLEDVEAALCPGGKYSEDDVMKLKTDIRALCNEYGTKCLSQIVTSVHRLSDLGQQLLPSGSPWFNHYLFLSMKPFTEEEGNALFDKMPPAWTLNQAQRDWIRELADGHPTLVQNACGLLWRNFHEKRNVESWQYADELLGQNRHIFEYEWKSSQKGEKLAMLLIALVHADGRVPGRNYNLSGLDTVLTQMQVNMFGLKDRGIIEERMEGAKAVFRFRSSLMEWWVVQNIQDAQDAKELAEREEILFGLSNRQVDRVKSAMSLIWKHKDAVTALVKWSGSVAGAFTKGFAGA
jgi:AAA ATPase-like protein